MLLPRRLRHPGARDVLAAVVVLVGLWHLRASLDAGWSSDDFVFQAIMDGAFAAPRHPLDLFNFADGTPEDAAALRRHAYPWWMPDEFKIRMLRPLASASIWFDRIVFGEHLWLHHVHSLGWWLVLVWGTWGLYRRRLSAGIALPALFFYALDASHDTPVIWLANRGGLVSVALGVWGLRAHLRWRERGERSQMFLSALAFSAALLCGEWLFCVYGYVLAYELVAAKDSLLRRALALGPSVVTALGFVGARAALRFGASASGVYVDPLDQPLAFLVQLGERSAVFLADMVLDVPGDWWSNGSPWRDRILQAQVFAPSEWTRMPPWQTWHVGLGVLAAVVGAAALRASWRGCDERTRQELAWLLVGAGLAMIPVAGSFPSRRLVIASMLGVAPAMAVVLRALLRGLLDAAGGRRPIRFAGAWCALVVLFDLQVFAPFRIDLDERVRWVRTAEDWVKHAALDPATVARQDVVIVTARDFVTTVFFPSTWRDAERPLPRSVRTLSLAPFAHRLRRTAENAFELDVLGSTFLGTEAERHFRPPSMSMRLGMRVDVDGMTAEVERMLEGLPRTVSFTFEESLDSPRYVFLGAQPGGMLPIPMPEVGDEVLLPRAAVPDFLARERYRYEAAIGRFPRFLFFDPVPAFIEYRPG